MQSRSSVQRRPKVASTSTHAGLVSSAFFVLPWQALALTVVLTMGASVHAYPRAFAPILRYGHGMALAAIEWHNAPPADSCAYAGR